MIAYPSMPSTSDDRRVWAQPLLRHGDRVNSIMAAVRRFLRHAVACGQLTRDALFEQVLRQHRFRSRHRLPNQPRPPITPPTTKVAALLEEARSARDRFIVTAMWRMGCAAASCWGCGGNAFSSPSAASRAQSDACSLVIGWSIGTYRCRPLEPMVTGRPRVASHTGAPRVVIEVDADVALHAGAWRHSLRHRRIRPDLSPEDLPPAPG